ncbi:MAG: adenylate/guanylate cyclase domain-containing protein [Desulfobacterales bacterium]|nr:adenylate/guanylate cyclase domain-containing protein [Desulfobacterales bacterium]
MSRIDCISNRNTRIIAAYVASRLGHHDTLFEGLPFPADRYASARQFFLDEDEWTTDENLQKIFRRAEALVGERYFYFNCGVSSARLKSWGRLDYFARVFSSPDEGYRRLPFFNKHFNDTQAVEVILPPVPDRSIHKIRTVLKIIPHADHDVNRDYTGSRYTRGIISAIPTIWGLNPAEVRYAMTPYDPVILFNEEPEFAPLRLQVRLENNALTFQDPKDARRRIFGKTVLLESEMIGGRKVFLGKYAEYPQDRPADPENYARAILITDTVRMDDQIIFKAGEIFRAPYFILSVTYDRLSLLGRLSQVLSLRGNTAFSTQSMIETINRLRESLEAQNETFRALEKANAQLKEAKKYEELRRYLSPKLTQKILTSGNGLGTAPQRKLMTVLFADIRNFSAITESLEAEEIFSLLDKYLSEMTRLIHRFDGTLNKIIGDGMLVFFGDPVEMEDHAPRAVMLAIEMQQKVSQLREEWLHYGHELSIGIGINTGYATVGSIGADTHKDYTVIGNQVNVAARLESLAKPGQILVSQRTLSRVKGRVKYEKIGEIRVKGISRPVVTYNVKS